VIETSASFIKTALLTSFSIHYRIEVIETPSVREQKHDRHRPFSIHYRIEVIETAMFQYYHDSVRLSVSTIGSK